MEGRVGKGMECGGKSREGDGVWREEYGRRWSVEGRVGEEVEFGEKSREGDGVWREE